MKGLLSFLTNAVRWRGMRGARRTVVIRAEVFKATRREHARAKALRRVTAHALSVPTQDRSRMKRHEARVEFRAPFWPCYLSVLPTWQKPYLAAAARAYDRKRAKWRRASLDDLPPVTCSQ